MTLLAGVLCAVISASCPQDELPRTVRIIGERVQLRSYIPDKLSTSNVLRYANSRERWIVEQWEQQDPTGRVPVGWMRLRSVTRAEEVVWVAAHFVVEDAVNARARTHRLEWPAWVRWAAPILGVMFFLPLVLLRWYAVAREHLRFLTDLRTYRSRGSKPPDAGSRVVPFPERKAS